MAKNDSRNIFEKYYNRLFISCERYPVSSCRNLALFGHLDQKQPCDHVLLSCEDCALGASSRCVFFDPLSSSNCWPQHLPP